MAAVIRIEDYRDSSRRNLASQLRRLAAERAERVEQMRMAERDSIRELAARIVSAS